MSIALEVMPDAGAPQVGITVGGLGASAVVSVDVSWDDGYSWHGVRGVQREEVVGGTAFFRDFVPPLNTEAVYRLTVHSGDPAAEGEAAILVPSATAWLQDPLAPRGALAVGVDLAGGGLLFSQGALADAVWEQPADYVVPEGASLPVASLGRRLLAGEVPLSVTYDTAAEAGRLRRLLLEAGTLVVRGLPHWAEGLLEPVAHVTVGTTREVRRARGQVTTWELSARQVRPTSMRIVVPWWTYEQVVALWQESLGVGVTYADVLAARPGDTYLDWQRDPEAP